MRVKTLPLAGLTALTPDGSDYLLALVTCKWRRWRLIQIYHGTLAQLQPHGQNLTIAFALPDEHVLHWLEEFPAHMPTVTILRYLKQSKPELFSQPSHHLTLEPLLERGSRHRRLRCWWLSAESRQAICQPFQAQGLFIAALEPLSALAARSTPNYQDRSQCLQRLAPELVAPALRAIKVACRHNWALDLC